MTFPFPPTEDQVDVEVILKLKVVHPGDLRAEESIPKVSVPLRVRVKRGLHSDLPSDFDHHDTYLVARYFRIIENNRATSRVENMLQGLFDREDILEGSGGGEIPKSIARLRERTQATWSDCRRALAEARGDFTKAAQIIEIGRVR